MQKDEGSASAAPRSYDPVAVARVLISTGETLTELLTSETALLRDARASEIGALCAEKTRLSQIFAAGWQQFQRTPADLEQLPPDMHARLAESGRLLARTAAENEMMLRSSRRVVELVLAAVAKAVDGQRPKPTYTAGRMARRPSGAQAGIGFSRSA